MESLNVNELLYQIDKGVTDFSERNHIIDAINQFQNDPTVLDKHLPRYVTKLTESFFNRSQDDLLFISEIYYNFCKVCSFKKVMKFLDSDIYLLPQLLILLERTKQSDWKVSFTILTWINLLIMSPFKLNNDITIYRLTSEFRKSSVLEKVVSNIHAELFIRNKTMFYQDFETNGINIESLNSTFKLIVNKKKSDAQGFISLDLLNKIKKYCIEEFKFNDENHGLIILKLLPKLCELFSLNNDWESIEDIISWILENLNFTFIELRFKLSRNFAKIVMLVKRFSEEMCLDLVESLVQETSTLLDDNYIDFIDKDILHSYLLIIAEFSRFKLLNVDLIAIIVKKIIPISIKFQQLRITKIQGHQVRDATNFICWSIAKNYQLSKSLILDMTQNLLVCSMFDHELIIRRSANAALQEVLGRYGSVILDNLTVVKLIELSVVNLENTYMVNSKKLCELFVIEYPDIFIFLLDWLLNYNIVENHDLKIVKLTSKVLPFLFRTIDGIQSFYDNFYLNLTKFGKSAIESEDRLLCARFLCIFSYLEFGYYSDELVEIANRCFQLLLKCELRKTVSLRESFEIFCFIKFLHYMIEQTTFTVTGKIIERLFQAIRSIGDWSPEYDELTSIFKKLVALISFEKAESMQEEVLELFWRTFYKFIHYNNVISCAALPHVHGIKFVDLFYSLMPKIDCQSKSGLIDSLVDRLPSILEEIGIGREEFLLDLTDLLDDYTITEQGDIGRKVRTSMTVLIQQHLNLFTGNDKIRNKVIITLLRLSGEPLDNLRVLSFKILCEIISYTTVKEPFNSQILNFYHTKFCGEREFWKGYLMSAGAVHSTDKQITSAIDAFLKYYQQLSKPDKLSLCNELIRIIPSQKELQISCELSSKSTLGFPKQDKFKMTLAFLTFWRRILESGIDIDSGFNFDGVYAKVYNIHLTKRVPKIKLASIRLFPLLALSHSKSINFDTKCLTLTNNIIKRLWRLSCSSNGDNSFTSIQYASLESLIMILLEFKEYDKVELLKSHSIDNKTLNLINEKDLVIHNIPVNYRHNYGI